MRVLYVTFGFPPRARWGTEFYTHQLALGVRERGHEVAVFHPVREGGEPRYRLERSTSEGFPVYLVHNQASRRKHLEESYSDEQLESVFSGVLSEWKPDVVHFMYLLWGMSARLPLVASERGIPTVVTLTDYGLLCHRGQMYDWRLRRCFGPHPAAVCARCVREPSRYDGSPARVLAKRWTVRALAAAGGLGLVATTRDLERRMQVIQRTLEAVDLFIAPTRVVERAFRQAGVAGERIVHLCYALRDEPFASARAEPPASGSKHIVRFGYLGQFMPHKGLHTLLEAVRILSQRLPESVEPWEVWLYGEGSFGRHRRYGEELFRREHGPRVYVCQPFEPFQAASMLAQLHAVVMPSEWDENAPLTALQARAAGVPVLASDVEGLTEIVEHGVHGLVFPTGNARALADAMREVILGRIRRTEKPSQPMPYGEHLAQMVGVYQHILDQAAGRRARMGLLPVDGGIGR